MCQYSVSLSPQLNIAYKCLTHVENIICFSAHLQMVCELLWNYRRKRRYETKDGLQPVPII